MNGTPSISSKGRFGIFKGRFDDSPQDRIVLTQRTERMSEPPKYARMNMEDPNLCELGLEYRAQSPGVRVVTDTPNGVRLNIGLTMEANGDRSQTFRRQLQQEANTPENQTALKGLEDHYKHNFGLKDVPPTQIRVDMKAKDGIHYIGGIR